MAERKPRSLLLNEVSEGSYSGTMASLSEAIRLCRAGIPPTHFRRICYTYSLTQEQICKALRLPVRTMMRRGRKNLGPIESEKIIRLGSALHLAEDVLGSAQSAKDWMLTPNDALNGETPISMLDTGMGYTEVTNILSRIDYGDFS